MLTLERLESYIYSKGTCQRAKPVYRRRIVMVLWFIFEGRAGGLFLDEELRWANLTHTMGHMATYGNLVNMNRTHYKD